MKCFSEQELQSYLLETVAEEAGTQIERHVQSCLACRESLQSLADDDLVRDYLQAAIRDDQHHLPATEIAGERSANWQPMSTNQALPIRFGRFLLEEFLGSGGFGMVYRARDLDLQRDVAIKIPHLGGLSPNVRARFLREGAAAASLHHPHIVQVHQAGEHDGTCFLVSEYCPGQTLRHLLNERGKFSSSVEAVQIALRLAQAVQTAHDHGVVHRDIKPANIILDNRTPSDELPFCPKLTDFGTARLQGADDSVTASGMLVGTARYMAPEQAANAKNMGPACDIYAVGVVLYELLAGRAPIQGEDNLETLRRVLDDEPPPLHRVVAGIPRDISAICTRCLEKNPQRRYRSAGVLAEDLRRYLNHQPTLARPLGPARRFLRWGRRNPLPLSISLTIACLLMVIAAGFARHNAQLRDVNSQLRDANRQVRESAEDARQSERHIRGLLYASDMQRAEEAWRAGDIKGALDILARYAPVDDHPDPPDLRGTEWHFLRRAAAPPAGIVADHGSPLYCVKLSPDARLFAVAGRDAVIRLHDRVSGQLERTIVSGQKEVNSVAFSPDGQLLASAGDDGSAKLWRLSDGRQVLHIAAHSGLSFGVAFTADGKRLITCGTDAAVHLWDAENGQHLRSFRDHRSEVEAIAVSPDGRWLASAGQDNALFVRNLATGELHFKWDRAQGTLSAVAFSPDSNNVAVGESAGVTTSLTLFSVASKSLVFTRRQPRGIHALDYSPDGKKLVTLDGVGTARIWDLVENGGRSEDPSGPSELWAAHEGRVYSVTFEPNGVSLLTAGKEGQVRCWNSKALVHEHLLDSGGTPIHEIAFLAEDGGLLAAAHGSLRLLRIGQKARALVGGPNTWSRVCAVPGRSWFAAATSTGWRAAANGVDRPARIHRWNESSAQPQLLLETKSTCNINELTCSPNGKHLAVVVHCFPLETGAKELWLLDAEKGSVLKTFPAAAGTKVRFVDNGRWLIYAVQQDLHLVDLDGKEHRLVREAHEDSQNGLAISRDEKWIATCDEGRRIKIWDRATLKLKLLLQGHRGLITGMEFSPNGRTLLSGSTDGTVKAWSVASGQSLMNLHVGSRPVKHIALANDGSRLAVLEDTKTVRVYELR